MIVVIVTGLVLQLEQEVSVTAVYDWSDKKQKLKTKITHFFFRV